MSITLGVRHLVLIAALVLGGCGSSDPLAPPNTNPPPGGPTATATVTTDAVSFSPQSVSITRGGTVRWTFGTTPHNVLFSATTGSPMNIGITSGQTTTRSFETTGTYSYSCSLHPGMAGTVQVI